MTQTEPDFWVLEYVTITRDPRTGLVVAVDGTEQAADILQRTGGFLSAPGPRGDYHRLPHGLPVEQQRLKATAASHALLAAGHSVYLDPALNMLVVPDGEREAALRYLAGLAERAATATTGSEVAEVLTEIAAPRPGAAAPRQRSRRPRLDRRRRLPGDRARREDRSPRAARKHRHLYERGRARHPPRPQPRRTLWTAAGHCLTIAGGPRPACGIALPLTAESLTANLADGCGKDVKTYIKALTANRFPHCLRVGRRTPYGAWAVPVPRRDRPSHRP
ncbi:hypothetical protein ABZ646_27140 [Streptomyces sp. NPDC007162]|uniref:hypothetical protein n=1 Tax=Streptomyces sp. NPDC007162 TaxID=3156917 RepID=UPI0033C6B16C